MTGKLAELCQEAIYGSDRRRGEMLLLLQQKDKQSQ